jgi:DNA-binding FadR family transcriptional regulator
MNKSREQGRSFLNRGGLHGQVTEHLGLRILRGEFVPGDTLPSETALGKELGVSRAVTRAAVKMLSAKGLVASRPKIGTRVLPRSYWNLLDNDILEWYGQIGFDKAFIEKLVDIRQIVEPAAAERAALRASKEEVAELERSFALMQKTVDEQDMEAFIAADMEFHAGILRACHNDMLEQMTRSVSTALITSRKITIQTPHGAETSLPLHKAVLAAIQKRDAKKANEAMRFLVDSAARDLEEILKRVEEPVSKSQSARKNINKRR